MRKLIVVSSLMLLCACMMSVTTALEAAQYDILLKGGHVIDPANTINGIMDVAMKGGKIARVARSIPAGEAVKTIDVSGYYVTPGFIDIHAHLFYTFFSPSARSVIPDDLGFPSGCTTMVDAGTSGAMSFTDFKKLIDRSEVRVLAFLNISALGMNPEGLGFSSENAPSSFNVPLAVETAKKYPDITVGFKTAHYGGYTEGKPPWASVDSVLHAGRLAGLPVMLDVHPRGATGNFPTRSYREMILEKMRPGDIYTHCFAPHFPVILKDGSLNPDVVTARERGIIFDVGHGAGSFAFRNAVPATKHGFIPDSFSTDLHGLNTWNGKVMNMINVMSKFLNMGVSLEDVIRRSTINPARIINRLELGNLSAGSPADIAVVEVLKGKYGYIDVRGGKIVGDKKLQCVMTLFDGEIKFDPNGLSMPLWENIPKDAPYWQLPVRYGHETNK